MPRYRANVLFGPWKPGEVFESTDDFHATLAEEGRLLSPVGEAPAPEPEPAPEPPQRLLPPGLGTPTTPDVPSGGAPAQDDES